MRAPRLAALLVAGLVLSGCAALTGDAAPGLSGLGNGDVAARGGEATVSVDELEAEVDALVADGILDSERYTGTELERRVQLQTRVLDALLKNAVAAAAAADEFGIEVDDADVDALIEEVAAQVGGIEELERRVLADDTQVSLELAAYGAVLQRAVADALAAEQPVTEEELDQAFEQRRQEFEQASVSHILVETRPQAQQVIQRLRGGEDFAAVAREVSLDPGSAENGGSLGLAPRGTYVAPFEEAIWGGPAEPGQLLGPVETDFGFHVIRVDEFQITPEDEARAQIEQEADGQRGGELYSAWFPQVLSDAEPEVAGRFGRWDPVRQRIVRGDEAEQGQQPGGQPQQGGTQSDDQ